VVLTDHLGVILLILRVVTDASGEAVQKIGSIYRTNPSKSLAECFEDLSANTTESTTAAQLKKIAKERLPTFSTPMVNHLVELAGSVGCAGAVTQMKSEFLASLGKGQGFLTLVKAGEEEVFNDFFAFPFSTVKSTMRACPSFNEAVDEFFSKIEQQKGQKAMAQQEKDAAHKLEAIRTEQSNRIRGLEDAIDMHLKRAQTIDAESKMVQDAQTVIRAALDAGMDWTQLQHVIEGEKKKENPVALLMKTLKLERGLVTLEIDGISFDVDVRTTPHANATRYYDLRKASIEKLQRTQLSFDRAMRSAEKKIRGDLSQSKNKAKRQQVFAKRKTLWFEKFNWFVSSDGFLVLAGRDMQQNEILVKRYLKEGDAYVHADMHGASSVIIKGRKCEIDGTTVSMTIPPRTLNEAGSMSLCNSRAWESKIVTSAWWVHAQQVSKTAPSGEFLPTGSFMIRGKKNFLPPAQLLYGFGFAFVLDDEAKGRQRAERIVKDAQLQEGMQGASGGVEKYMNMLDIDDEAGEQIDVTSNMPKPKHLPKDISSRKGRANKKSTPVVSEKHAEDKPAGSATRGSKAKQKKIAKKYGGQDEEERAMRMGLLASQKKEVADVEKVHRPIKVTSIEEKPLIEKANNIDEDVRPTPVLETSVPQPAQDEAEDEEVLAVGEDELTIIDAITGNLRANLEHVLYAIPVAGPITALSNYTFRLKLMPGSLKRGKAVQQALSILLSDARDLDAHAWSASVEVDGTHAFKSVKEMIRAVPDADLNQTMLGHVKIMATAKELLKSKTAIKKAKK